LFLPSIAGLDRVTAGGPHHVNATLAAALTWMIAFAVVGYQKGNFACPRCGNLYFRKFDDRPGHQDWWNKPWARHCLHCGLPKWADRDDAATK
jgi:hypothetical protein